MFTSPVRCRSGANRWTWLVLLALLAGCSSTTFLYNRLDTLISWYLSDYVSLTREQDALFDKQLEALHDWHRREELPQYIVLLDAVDEALDSPLTDAELNVLYNRFLAVAERLRVKMTAVAIDFGSELSLEQRLEFVASIRDNQQTWYDERIDMDDDAYRKLLVNRFTDNLADFLGRLNDEQRQLIDERTKGMLRLHEEWHTQRSHWLDRLEAALRDNPDNWQVPVKRALDSWDSGQSDGYRATFAHNQRTSQRLILDIVNGRTARQDKRLRGVIADYRKDFASLLPAELSLVEQ